MKTNTKHNLLITISAILSIASFSLLMIGYASAQDEEPESEEEETYDFYNYYDQVFFDPVNVGNTRCNETNYWTPRYTETTCYRWFLIGEEDSEESESLHVMLDHDVANVTFSDINDTLQETAETWTNYDGELNIINEDEIEIAMKLTERPTLENISVNGGRAPSLFRVNSLYYINGAKTNTYGFWSSTLYPEDETYAYTITEYGNNRLVKTTSLRGVRPVINIEKERVTKFSDEIDATEIVGSSDKYEFAFPTEPIEGTIYKQLQGFTVTNDSIVFFSSNSNTPDNGVLFAYTGEDYSTPKAQIYDAMGHGNGMGYDPEDNQVLLVGPNSYKDIWFFDGTTLEFTKKEEVNNNISITFNSIGYIDDQNFYVGGSGLRAYILDKDFNILDTIDTPYDEIVQDLDYNNGYLYITTYNSNTCPNKYTIFCNYDGGSGVIYVYNLKYNEDGTPSENFGRLAERLYIGPGFGELESIAFHGDEAFLGYSAQGAADYDNSHSFRFYHLAYSTIAPTEPEPEPEPEPDNPDTPDAPDTGTFSKQNDFVQAFSSKTGIIIMFIFFAVSIIGLFDAVLAKRSHFNKEVEGAFNKDASEESLNETHESMAQESQTTKTGTNQDEEKPL